MIDAILRRLGYVPAREVFERDRVIEVIANQRHRSAKASQIARNFLMRRELTR